jgi:HNH endonuclease
MYTEQNMAYTDEKLNDIFDRTSGYCHICHKKLAFINYGLVGKRGAWEVEHSNPKAKGGTSRLNNLYPAHISCNRSKKASSTRSARLAHGKSRAPLASDKRKKVKRENAIVGGILGARIGWVFGPPGAFVGALIGAHLGHKQNPDK